MLVPADVVEEVARLYVNENIGESISPYTYVEDKEVAAADHRYRVIRRIKDYLANAGCYEVYTYSMYSQESMKLLNLAPQDHLEITNPISVELRYMRRSLIPSLRSVFSVSSQLPNLTIFECANVYLPQQNDLPLEKGRLGLMSTQSFERMKGMVENIATMLHVKQHAFTTTTTPRVVDGALLRVNLVVNGKNVGEVGMLRDGHSYGDVDLESLIQAFDPTPALHTRKRAPVIEDITYEFDGTHTWTKLVDYLYKRYPAIDRIEYRGSYHSVQRPTSITMRLYSYPKAGTSLLPEIVKDLESECKLHLKR